MDEPMGPTEQRIEDLFTRELVSHPLVLSFMTGIVRDTDPDLDAKSLQALGLILSVQRMAIRQLAREVDDLRSV